MEERKLPQDFLKIPDEQTVSKSKFNTVKKKREGKAEAKSISFSTKPCLIGTQARLISKSE